MFVQLTNTAATVDQNCIIIWLVVRLAAPRVCSDLPIEIRNSVTSDRFRSALRTHYYRLARFNHVTVPLWRHNGASTIVFNNN